MSLPRLIMSIYGKGVIHVAVYSSSMTRRRAYYTMCGSTISHPVLRNPEGPPTCQGCLQALGLDQGAS